MAEGAFATALYEQLPEGHPAAAAAAAARRQHLGSAAAAAAAGGEGEGVGDLLLLQRQQQLLRRAAMLQQCSFFELLAQQKLLDGLHAALRHCVVTFEAFYTNRAPAAAATPTQQHHQNAAAVAGATPERLQPQQGRSRGGPPQLRGGPPQLRSLRGSFLSAWLWRRVRHFAAAAAAAAAAVEPGRLRLVLVADFAAALRWMERHFDMIYLILLAAVETHSFAATGASFSDGFYCLGRESSSLFRLHRMLNHPRLSSSSNSNSSSNSSRNNSSSSSSGRSIPPLQQQPLPLDLMQQQQQINREAAALAVTLPPSLSRIQIACCVIVQVLLPHLRRQLQRAHALQQESPAAATAAAATAAAATAAAATAAAREAVAAAAANLKKHNDAPPPPPPLPLEILSPADGSNSNSNSSSSSSSDSNRTALLLTAAAAAWGDRLRGWLRSLRLRLVLILLRYRLRLLLLRWWMRRSLWDRVVAAFPRLSLCHDLLSFFYSLLYLADPVAFPYWSPYMHLLGLVYVRAVPDATGGPAAAAAAAAATRSSSRKSWWFSAAEGGAQRMRSCLVGVLLLLRALEWWFEYEATLMPPPVKREEIKAPPPPPRPTNVALTCPLPQVLRDSLQLSSFLSLVRCFSVCCIHCFRGFSLFLYLAGRTHLPSLSLPP